MSEIIVTIPLILKINLQLFFSEKRRHKKRSKSPLPISASSDSSNEEEGSNDDEGVWVEKKISMFIITFYIIDHTPSGKDADGGFIGPVPEIKVQSTNNKME